MDIWAVSSLGSYDEKSCLNVVHAKKKKIKRSGRCLLTTKFLNKIPNVFICPSPMQLNPRSEQMDGWRAHEGQYRLMRHERKSAGALWRDFLTPKRGRDRKRQTQRSLLLNLLSGHSPWKCFSHLAPFSYHIWFTSFKVLDDNLN